jgi:DNA-binding protein H-NS
MDERKLEKMDMTELVALATRVNVAILSKGAAQKAALKAQIEQMAADAGLSIEDVMGISKGKTATRKPKGSVPPKYRNPADPSQTWTGRGRRPLWIKSLNGSLDQARVGA